MTTWGGKERAAIIAALDQINDPNPNTVDLALMGYETALAEMEEALRPLANQTCDAWCFPDGGIEPHRCVPEEARAVLAKYRLPPKGATE